MALLKGQLDLQPKRITVFGLFGPKPIPVKTEKRLIRAKTVLEIQNILVRSEKRFAEIYFGCKGEVFWIVVYTQISFLKSWKNIAHTIVVGKSDEGSAHAWVRAVGKNYDPYRTRFWRRKIRSCLQI